MELAVLSSSKALTRQDTSLSISYATSSLSFFLIIALLSCLCLVFMWETCCEASKRSIVKALVKSFPLPRLQRYVVTLHDGQKVSSYTYPEVPFFE